MANQKKRVVIIGGGFGGIYVARTLIPFIRKGLIDVSIINKTNHFVFMPLLHEVATGGLSPGSITEPLREIFSGTNIHVIEGSVSVIDASQKKVVLNRSEIFYDYLVIATGSDVNYYNTPGASEYGLPLRNIEDAIRIRNRIIDEFQKAEESSRAHISFVVVGGGATGIEVAAELEEFSSQITKKYYPNIKAKISLASASQDILQNFPSYVSRVARARLVRKGIAIECGRTAQLVSSECVTCNGDIVMEANAVIWAAGVKPAVPEFSGLSPLRENGRIAVDEYFRCIGAENIFALGDVAGFKNFNETNQLPMLAQVAVRESETVTKNIIASIRGVPLSHFRFRSRGMFLSLGKWYAAGTAFSLNIKGFFAWWVWRTIYLFNFFSWRKRIKIAFEWTLHIFSSRDITRV